MNLKRSLQRIYRNAAITLVILSAAAWSVAIVILYHAWEGALQLWASL